MRIDQQPTACDAFHAHTGKARQREEWKPVVGYEALYEVSSDGQIRSLPRIVPCVNGKRVSPGRLMKLQKSTSGYRHVCLSKDGIVSTVHLHRIVANAFLGMKPEGADVVRHLDGNPSNNDVSNLAWGSFSENEADKSRHGRVAHGERNGFSKLTESQVIDLRLRFARGDNRMAMAREFGISKCNLYAICRGDRWKHLIETHELVEKPKRPDRVSGIRARPAGLPVMGQMGLFQ